jgi:hypothetical protein
MGMNAGYYEVTHVNSGKKFKILHKTSEWREHAKFVGWGKLGG